MSSALECEFDHCEISDFHYDLRIAFIYSPVSL